MTVVIVMGVCGSGKTTIGRELARSLGLAFVEGDSFHPPANVEKMWAGRPLDDADRGPWLAAIAGEIDRRRARGEGAVIACSALKRRYRDVLRRDGVRFVHLTGDPALLRGRMEARRDHYMPASLLDSQLAALEPPGPDEGAIAADVDAPPDRIVARLRAALARPGG